MRRHVTSFGLLIPCLAGCAAVASCAASAHSQQQPDADRVRIGIIASLFDEKDEKQVLAQMQPFADSIKKRTDVAGEFVVVQDPVLMGRMLREGTLHLGILHGVEYGWLRSECADCKPILLAVNETPVLTAHVLVPKESPAKNIADLKGKRLILPRRTQQHTRVFLERLIDGEAAKYFEPHEGSPNVDEAIDAVIDGKADLTLLGNVAMETYRQRKPGRFNRLRVLAESPPFPAAVIVRRPGQKREADIRKFQQSLMAANETPEGRQTLNLWRLTAFMETPRDYEQQVDEIVKKYPMKQ